MRVRSRFIIVGSLSLVAAGVVFFVSTSSDDFAVGHQGKEVEFQVAVGESGNSISQHLARQGVIKTAKRFYHLAIADSRSQSIAPGTHRLDTHVPAKIALDQLLDQSRIIGIINVVEGSTAADVWKILKANSAITDTAKANIPKTTLVFPNNSNSVEGQLFPAQYSFPPKVSAKSVIGAMLAKFANIASAIKLQEGFEKYDGYQVLIVASMAQVEANEQDFGKVARVIYNRLRIGMPLQLNSSVQYALDKRGQIQLSITDTKVESPYNTYRNLGLTPTPISNPGRAAIVAALHPVTGDWIYFITVKPGDTRFTAAYETFKQWELLYHQNLAAGAFK
jgi:UPF0755 protein